MSYIFENLIKAIYHRNSIDVKQIEQIILRYTIFLSMVRFLSVVVVSKPNLGPVFPAALQELNI